MAEGTIPIEVFAKSAHSSAARVPGTAIFMASTEHGVPSALLHNIKHNKVLHERVVILTVAIQDVPYVDEAERFAGQGSGQRLLPADRCATASSRRPTCPPRSSR